MFNSQLLLGKNVTREAKDKRNNTVYHYAAITTKDIIAVRQDSLERRSIHHLYFLPNLRLSVRRARQTVLL